MKARCYNQNKDNYSHYGGVGITICDRWLGKNGFTNFVEDMRARPKGKTIDRIDNNKGYEPSNCRWSSKLTQTFNRSITREFEGVSLGKYCELNNLNYATVMTRVRKGYSYQEATNPNFKAKIRHDSILVAGVPLKEYCRSNNLTYSKVLSRYRIYGWSLEDALTVDRKPLMIGNRTLSKYCKEVGISYQTVLYRIRKGANIEDAVKPPFSRWV